MKKWTVLIGHPFRKALYRESYGCAMCHHQSATKPERLNAVGIQMLSESLHRQIFDKNHMSNADSDELTNAKIKKHLQDHGLWDKPTTQQPDVDFQLPGLVGKNIEQHFFAVTMKLIKPYIELADRLHNCTPPAMPEKWVEKPGWYKYSDEGQPVQVSYPEEEAIVFDVETLVSGGNYPLMASAVSDKAWYTWCAPRLKKDLFVYSLRKPEYSDLVPLETKDTDDLKCVDWKPRLVIGHNVSFDRSFIREQYLIKGSKMRFLDTMSLHIATSGFTSYQRVLWNAKKSGSRSKAVTEAQNKTNPKRSHHKDNINTPGPLEEFSWMNRGTINGLGDIYKHYCQEGSLAKDKRKTFVSGSVEDINADFQNLMTYCANDSLATLKVYQKLWSDYRQRFPSPVTLGGMLEMGTAYLPVNKSWNRYIETCDLYYNDAQEEISQTLSALAAEACKRHSGSKSYKDDPWLYDVDWECKDIKFLQKPRSKDRIEIDESLHPTVKKVLMSANRLPKKIAHMPGVPNWYAELFMKCNDPEWKPGACLITTAKRITPKLLKLTWDGYPLYWHEKHGWGYIVPYKEDEETDAKLEQLESELEGKQMYPYKAARKVAYSYETTDKSTSVDVNMSQVIDENIEKLSLTYKQSENIWNKVRVMTESQKKLFYEKKAKKGKEIENGPSWHSGVGPFSEVSVHGGWFFKLPHKDGGTLNVGNPLSKDHLSKIEDGTLSSAVGGNAVSALLLSKMCSYWKNNRDRILSQMVICLDDSQLPSHVKEEESFYSEGKYGAIIPKIVTAGTVTRRAVEKTWLTASNAKSDRLGSELKSIIQAPPGYHFVGADVDSQELWIATLLGDAYFAGIHGSTAVGWMTLQGQKQLGTDLHSNTAKLIGISRDEAKVFNYGRIYGAGNQFATKLLSQFNHRLTQEEAKEKSKKMYEATKGKRKRVKPESSLSYRMHWVGGSESSMFNRLEEIAVSKDPRTPVLRCKISECLNPTTVGGDFMTSRINWVVQSSAVDYLHLMLVCMRWLFDEYNIDGRFCISIHDEVRYLVKSEDRYRAALALHITNLYVRSLFAYKLNMHDLPQSVAFFSAVDIDKCLRKESSMKCITPSNTSGMEKGYGIPEGESLDIYETLKKTEGNLCATESP